MLADGIYSVHFETPLGEGSGVVVVDGDKLRGGDASFAYFGTLLEAPGPTLPRSMRRAGSVRAEATSDGGAIGRAEVGTF
jgi:hypothetical protein